MLSTRFLLVLCFSAAIAGAQTITNTHPPVVGFLDLSTNGGTVLVPSLTGDSEHDIVTTVGNPLFPAGNVRIANDGVAVAGITTGDVASTNVAIPAAGFPAGIPAGTAAILPWWQNLCPAISILGFPPGSILWKEAAGVLYIEWFAEAPACNVGSAITFEVQVFGTPALGAPWIQIFYPDTVFAQGLIIGSVVIAPPDPCNDGACATIGYVAGPSFGHNAQWSFATAAVSDGTVLSIFPEFILAPSSPLGPGSIMLELASGAPNGSYFFAVTSAHGSFPNGWLFGLDIAYGELAGQIAAGFPFSGPLDSAGNFSLGPIQGLPPVTIYAIAFAFMPATFVPLLRSAAISYTIP